METEDDSLQIRCQNCQDCGNSDNYYAFLTNLMLHAPELPEGIVYIPGILEPWRFTTIWARVMSSPTTIAMNRAFKIGLATTGLEYKGALIDFITVVAINATPENLDKLLDSTLYDSPDVDMQMFLTKGLAVAISHSKFDNATTLLRRGGDINAPLSKNNRTSIINAILSEKVKTVKYLIDNGADLDVYDADYDLPIHLAVKKGNCAIVELLIKSRRVNLLRADKIDRVFFLIPIRTDKLDILVMILDNFKDLVFDTPQGLSLLQYAASYGSLQCMQLLIARGFQFVTLSPPNLICLCLHNALLSKTVAGRLEKVKFLLDLGASPYELMIPSFLKFLREQFQAFKTRIVDSDPAIVVAILTGAFEEFKLLLNAGTSPNTRIFGNGQTCALLHLVFEIRNVPMAQHLISLGADVSVRDYHGRTPFDYNYDPGFVAQVFAIQY